MDRLYPLTVVTPAATLTTATVKTPFPLEDANLKHIDIVIPDGCVGLVGFRVLRAGTQIIPFANSYFLTPNGETIHVDFDDQMTATGLVVESYNLDVFDHSLYFRALIQDFPLPESVSTSGTSGSVILPVNAINGELTSSNLLVASSADLVDNTGVDQSGALLSTEDIAPDGTVIQVPLPIEIPLLSENIQEPTGIEKIGPVSIPPPKTGKPKPPVEVPPHKIKRPPVRRIKGLPIGTPIRELPPHRIEHPRHKVTMVAHPDKKLPVKHRRKK